MSERFGLTRKLELPVNPFTDEFLQQELAWYDFFEPYSKGGVEVRMVRPAGIIDDYLNKNMRLQGDILVPALFVDGRLWMSLTFMEIQSLYVPIALAGGVVGTAGLGLGYFALRAAAMEDVERVDVFEIEPRVVKFFNERFRGRPEFEKINITVGDARRDMLWNKRGKRSFDYIFMDVYQTLLPNSVIGDIQLFKEKASFQEYRFWGQELVLLDAVMAGERPKLSFLEKAFFRTWENTVTPGDDFPISDLYRPLTDPTYREMVLEPLDLA